MQKHVFLKYEAIAPISHLTPPEGKQRTNVAEQRTMNMVGIARDHAYNEEESHILIKVPVASSGQAHRAVPRREFITRVLDVLGFSIDNVFDGLERHMFEAMLNGGTKSKATPEINAYKYTSIYSELPFFGLFGGCLYGNFYGGRLSVKHVVPVVAETVPLFEIMGSPFAQEFRDMNIQVTAEQLLGDNHRHVRFDVKNIAQAADLDLERLLVLLEDNEEATAAYEAYETEEAEYDADGNEKPKKFTEFRAYLLKEDNDRFYMDVASAYRITDRSNKKKSVEEIIKKISKSVTSQMIYSTANVIPMGTTLHSRVSLMNGYGDDNLMEMAFDAYMEVLLERGYLGGMASKGYGEVVAEGRLADGRIFTENSRADEFWAWLKDNKEQLREKLMNLKGYLASPVA